MRDETLRFPFGKSEIEVKIPKENILQVLKPREPAGLAEETKEIIRALQNPIGTQPLNRTIEPNSSVALIVSDITRPVPSNKIVPSIIDELNKILVPDENIMIIVALGMHRKNTEEEIELMLGRGVLERIRVVNHDCYDKRGLTYIGETSRRTPLEVNNLVANADIKITTGYIEPHEIAGFTGGRKSILPGVSGVDALRWNHRPEMLNHPKARIGVLDGNPIHEDMVEAAEMVGVDFIVNVVLNSRKEIAKVVAGDLKKAYYKGVRFYEQYAGVKVDQPADIVIASSGYPLDCDFYQSIKSVIAAEPFVKEGGAIILLTESRDGLGPPLFSEWMKTVSSPDEIVEKIQIEGYSPEVDHCYLLARILKKCEVIAVSQHPLLREIKIVKTTDSIKTALDIAFKKRGKDSSVITLPYATRIIPK